MKKKVDERIRTLIENGVKLRHRSMFVIVGDKYRDQIVNLHFILSKAVVKARPSVLWCYKDKLDISSNKRKRLKQTRALIKKGLLDVEKLDPFLLFAETGNLTYCKYENSDSILGNTFGMCILQDFEALTPNLLARTMETVEGGGLTVLVIHSLSSLTSLFTMVMDVHHRFRTESHYHATGRFNERFLLSLASCKACIVMDDELNILPISSHVRSVVPISVSKDFEGLSEAERDLKNLKESLHDEVIVGPLIRRCCTMDQGKALATFLNAVMDKTLHATIALTAARGRGKSAALGLAIAGAVATGFSNIYVTAPSPENLKTLFEFVCHGLDELGYKKPLHYDSVTNDKSYLKKSLVRINIYKQHRQTIQYLNPNDHQKLSQVELLVIDEAAAIPLPIVKAMLGPYLVFLSSTVNGYEGTGRSLSLKLLQQLDKESNTNADNSVGSHGHFERVELVESIRYASNDPIESWLNGLLCLDVACYIPCLSWLPPAEQCDLYYVNRDTLFSYHKDSEVFLQRMMALYVASHYKNSPNDLQLMADAPAHHLFVLLGPVDESKNHLPDILCVVQVCLEGQISKKSVMKSLSSGHHPFGDQIPWKFFEQFRDDVFPTLSGARIVRITVHPNAMGLKYGSRAVEMLTRYYKGEITQFNEDEEEIQEALPNVDEITEKVSLLEENIMPRSNLPPLLVHLRERKPEKLHYLGVSFGLTLELFRFWRKHCFVPFYICQIPNDVTGEHNCMMLKALENEEIEDSKYKDFGFVSPYYHDFKCRFVQLLSSSFRGMGHKLAMSILDPKLVYNEGESAMEAQGALLSPHAMKRLEDYTNNFIDYHTILDIVPIISRQYFLEKIPVSLAYSHALVLFCMGLQHYDVTYIEKELDVERQQVISSLKKTTKKLYKHLNSHSAEINSTQPRREISVEPHSVSLDELNEATTKEVGKTMETENGGPLYPEKLQRYTIIDRDADFESALQNIGGNITAGGVLSVKSSLKQKKQKLGTNKEPENFKKRAKELDRSLSNSQRKKKKKKN